MATPRELLDYAKKIFASASSEVERETVVNRAYYAAYHAAKQFHDALPYPGHCFKEKAGVHERLIQQLQNPRRELDAELANTSRYICNEMKGVKALREIADYESDPPRSTTAADCEEAIKAAADILDEVKRGNNRLAKLAAEQPEPLKNEPAAPK